MREREERTVVIQRQTLSYSVRTYDVVRFHVAMHNAVRVAEIQRLVMYEREKQKFQPSPAVVAVSAVALTFNSS
jgi:hypothetical protein